MDELLKFILEGITGKSVPFSKSENKPEQIIYEINPENSEIGILIGKNGTIIKSIQNILRIRGKLENKFVIVKINNQDQN
ncbi:MAG: KH domain-containing protein [Patescibacteria group bacterium]|nr:KH domain-containing protein [Patescibacteria group bacterium]